MELDLVDPLAVPVVRAQPRRVLVCLRPPLLHLGRAGGPPERRQLAEHLVEQPRIQMPFDPGREGPVGSEDVVPDQRRDLVAHGVGAASHVVNLPGECGRARRIPLGGAASK